MDEQGFQRNALRSQTFWRWVVGDPNPKDSPVVATEAPPEFSLANAEVLFGNRSIGWYRWAAWFAEKIQASGTIPFKNASAAFAVLCKGDELGLPPFAAWNLLYMTKAGRLALMSKGALAVVQSKATFQEYSERLEGTGKEMKAVAVAKRKGFAATVKEFSYEQAERAGLLKPRTNQDGRAYDSTYQSYLEDMLLARARARALDIAFAAELGGIAIEGAAEDADMMEDRRHAPSAPPPATKPSERRLLKPGPDPLIQELEQQQPPVEAEFVPATLAQEIDKSLDDAFGASTAGAVQQATAPVITPSGAPDAAQPGAGTPVSLEGGPSAPGPAPGSGRRPAKCPKCGSKMHKLRGCEECWREERDKADAARAARLCSRCGMKLNAFDGCDVCGFPGPDIR